MGATERGIVRIKPVYIGIHHYRDVYGSVCSADVIGTPPMPSPDIRDLERNAESMIERFRKNLDVDFVRIEEPLIVREEKDLRRLPAQLSFDIDALLVGTLGAVPLEVGALYRYGLPVLRGPVSSNYLRALRVKKFLRESRFLYIGEIPSFSAPNGPWDFSLIERRFGLRVRHIETNEFYRWFDRFSPEEVKEELEKWSEDFDEILEPSEEELIKETRAYMALRYLAEREDANGITVNCGRFTEERPVVPCLAFARLIDEGIMCGCEGDITAMISMLMLHGATGQSVMMGNFGARPGAFQAREGEVTIEHDVLPLSMSSGKFIVRDYHGRKFGVTGYADIKQGVPMTLLNLDPSLERISVVEGKIKESEDGIHCRIIVHMEVNGDVKRVPQIMVGSQHVSMTFGHWLGTFLEVGKLLGLEVRHL
ncbi:TPA: hypothetical protein ENG04_06450 [Candidatus Poribacteria bacterium]|nr:hypothetical protein [Candidatus Poribacteria bacterium]HEX29704.1 hypothetical protein [Candidatus Poribacteria bacterium]